MNQFNSNEETWWRTKIHRIEQGHHKKIISSITIDPEKRRKPRDKAIERKKRNYKQEKYRYWKKRKFHNKYNPINWIKIYEKKSKQKNKTIKEANNRKLKKPINPNKWTNPKIQNIWKGKKIPTLKQTSSTQTIHRNQHDKCMKKSHLKPKTHNLQQS